VTFKDFMGLSVSSSEINTCRFQSYSPKTKNPTNVDISMFVGFNYFYVRIPVVGVEPTLQRNTILSRARLPIPPHRHNSIERLVIYICKKLGAEDRNRTGTVVTYRRILSPVRLPVPPPRRIINIYINMYS
jgi:hypothetical protein